ncbi:MAG: hypothetical protein KDC11_12505 [Chitinophagaceae bacterium]|nr:hypothetical protein [Chitinophagaceae bacterium]
MSRTQPFIVTILILTILYSCNKDVVTKQSVEPIKEIQTPAYSPTLTNPVINTPIQELRFTEIGQPLVLYYNSWDGNYPNWGYSNINQGEYYHNYSHRVKGITALTIHVGENDLFTNNITKELYNNPKNKKFTPQFWVNEKFAMDKEANKINLCNSDEVIYETVKSEKLNTDKPYLAARILGDSLGEIKVEYGVKYRGLVSSNKHYIMAYLAEDSVRPPNNSIRYDGILRAAADGAYGTPFTETDLNENVFIRTATFDIADYNKDELYIVIALWDKDAQNNYNAICGYHVKVNQ